MSPVSLWVKPLTSRALAFASTLRPCFHSLLGSTASLTPCTHPPKSTEPIRYADRRPTSAQVTHASDPVSLFMRYGARFLLVPGLILTASIATERAACGNDPAKRLSAPARPFGLSKRVPWTARITGSPDPPPPYRLDRVFPR